MTKENKTKIIFLVLVWVIAVYPFYLILSFLGLFLNSGIVVCFGIFMFFAMSGIFIGGAEKKIREEKVDKLLDRELKETE